jgi:sodium-dependent dicarboxylate transporter 2/3/5
MAVWYPLVGMPGNIDMMKTPAKLTMTGYELIVPPEQPLQPE